MNSLDAVILGVVEGLTEFLPISSTGHLIITADLLGLPETEFLKSFQIVIQLGAILAVIALYWRRLFFDVMTIRRIALALIPALGIGAIFYTAIRSLLASELTVILSLGIGGVFLIIFERYRREPATPTTIDTLSYRQAFLIGCAQAFSVIPGVSRAGATIVGGLAAGLTRAAAVEFSFLLGVPTMIAATTLDLSQNYSLFSLADFELLAIGFLVSFFIAILAIKFLLRFVESHTFVAFGVYRIIAAIFFGLIIL